MTQGDERPTHLGPTSAKWRRNEEMLHSGERCRHFAKRKIAISLWLCQISKSERKCGWLALRLVDWLLRRISAWMCGRVGEWVSDWMNEWLTPSVECLREMVKSSAGCRASQTLISLPLSHASSHATTEWLMKMDPRQMATATSYYFFPLLRWIWSQLFIRRSERLLQRLRKTQRRAEKEARDLSAQTTYSFKELQTVEIHSNIS